MMFKSQFLLTLVLLAILNEAHGKGFQGARQLGKLLR